MTYEVFETKEAAAKTLAAEVAELIRSRAAEGKGVVLGLATGATPLPYMLSSSVSTRRKVSPSRT